MQDLGLVGLLLGRLCRLGHRLVIFLITLEPMELRDTKAYAP